MPASGPFGDFLQASEESLRATVSVNVMAPVVLSRRLLPGMLARAKDERRRRAGLIIVSSNTAFLPVPRLAAYAASKAFDLSLAEALAAELAGGTGGRARPLPDGDAHPLRGAIGVWRRQPAGR